MDKKKLKVAIGTIVTVFMFSFVSFGIIKNTNINSNRIKGDVDSSGASISISCAASTLEVGENTTCSLIGTVPEGALTSVNGTLTTNSNLRIDSVSKNSIFSGSDGNPHIVYTNGTGDSNANVTIATITVTAMGAGNGTLTIGPTTLGSGSALYNVDGYTANITTTISAIEQSNNANLRELKVNGTTVPGFNPANSGPYTFTLDSSVSTAQVTATPQEAGSATIVSGTETYSLEAGETKSVSVVVKAGNQTTTRTYTLNIVRPSASTSSTDNSIETIVVKNGETEFPVNKTSASQYDANVTNTSINSVNVSVSIASTSTVTINGERTASKNISLVKSGTTRVTIIVTSQSGSPKTYTLNITKKASSGGTTTTKSSVATLSSLSVTNTKISSNFSSTAYSYKASVKNSVDSVTITAKATDSKASVSGAGKKDLKVGSNSFNIIVTAENGSKKIYNIIIVREEKEDSKSSSTSSTTKTEEKKDSNALLKELVINNNKMTLSNDTLSYNYTVLYEVEDIDIKAVAKSDKAKVKIEGNTGLEVGKNTVIITVTAEDGTEKVYLINVTKKEKNQLLSDDSTLSTLEIKGHDIKFDPNNKKYEVKISNETALDIDYITSNENANVVITGNRKLKNGSVVTVEVTAENGTKSKYEITVKKKMGAKVFLFTIFGIALVAGAGYLGYTYIKNMPRKEKEDDDSSTSEYSQADVYDEYVKNTQVPDPESYEEDEETDNQEDNEVTNSEETTDENITSDTEETPSTENLSEQEETTPVEPEDSSEEEDTNEITTEDQVQSEDTSEDLEENQDN